LTLSQVFKKKKKKKNFLYKKNKKKKKKKNILSIKKIKDENIKKKYKEVIKFY